MKNYVKPELKLEKIELEDVIAASKIGSIDSADVQKNSMGGLVTK